MYRHSAWISLAIFAAALVACDRSDVQDLAAKAERGIERAKPLVEDAAVTAKVKSALVVSPEVARG